MRFDALSPLQKLLLAVASAGFLAVSSTLTYAQDEIPNAGRLAYVGGNVSIEHAGVDTWGQALVNSPLGPGDRIYTDTDGRAEIQVGQTWVRIGPSTDVTVSNENPQSIAFGLAQGSIHVHSLGLWQGQAMQVATPNANLTAFAASDVRVDTAADQSSSVYTGFGPQVLVTGAGGFQEHLENGQSLEIAGSNPVYPQWLQPAPDDLDNWSSQRDRQIANAQSFRYVSPEIPGAVDLDANGDWDPDTDYGPAWFPRGVPGGWAPYHYGHWVNQAPWGWTWVEDEPWGYAPFHYGRWVSIRGRWGWIPGPPAARPIYAPALVVFAGGISIGGGGVSVWFPLGPGEAYRPSYPCPPHYVDDVNISNIRETRIVHVQKTYVNIVNVTNVTNITYVNRTNGVTAMNHNDFATGRRASEVSVKVDPHQMEHIKVIDRPEPKPTQQSFVGRPVMRPVPVKVDRPVLVNSEGKLQAAKPGSKPVEAPVRPVAAPRPLPGRVAVAPPPNAKNPTPPGKAPIPPSKPEAKPMPAPAPPVRTPNPPPGRPEVKPVPDAPPVKPPAPPPGRPDSRPGQPPSPPSRPAPPPPRTVTPPPVRDDAPPARPSNQPPPRPDTRPSNPPPPHPEAKPAPPKPEDRQAHPPAKPDGKPDDKHKKPEDKDKKPE